MPRIPSDFAETKKRNTNNNQISSFFAYILFFHVSISKRLLSIGSKYISGGHDMQKQGIYYFVFGLIVASIFTYLLTEYISLFQTSDTNTVSYEKELVVVDGFCNEMGSILLIYNGYKDELSLSPCFPYNDLKPQNNTWQCGDVKIQHRNVRRTELPPPQLSFSKPVLDIGEQAVLTDSTCNSLNSLGCRFTFILGGRARTFQVNCENTSAVQ